MPCPLFLPDPTPGDYSSGRCATEPLNEIAEDKLRRYCNRGYARSVCDHANAIEADAAQFLIQADREGIVQVAWSLERDHHPLAVGVIEVSESQKGTTALEVQAIFLTAAYRKQKGSSA